MCIIGFGREAHIEMYVQPFWSFTVDSKLPFHKIKTLKLFKTIETMQQKQTASCKNAYLQVLFLYETNKYMTRSYIRKYNWNVM